MYQYEAVEKAMRDNGGYATLKHLYENAPNIKGSEWETKTPNASIRRIVQKRDRFFKIRPGLWALTAQKEELPESVYSESASDDKQDKYSHWYFQGLLTEVGNIRRDQTWVPAQDKNREFLDKTLGDVSTLETLPQFGYDRFVQRASTIDVIWFNRRKMPDSFIEVEFSTDFQNSLLKFSDLQDYNTNFIIASDSSRRSQFEKRIEQTAFEAIRDRVQFVNFERVSEWHAAMDKTDQLLQNL